MRPSNRASHIISSKQPMSSPIAQLARLDSIQLLPRQEDGNASEQVEVELKFDVDPGITPPDLCVSSRAWWRPRNRRRSPSTGTQLRQQPRPRVEPNHPRRRRGGRRGTAPQAPRRCPGRTMRTTGDFRRGSDRPSDALVDPVLVYTRHRPRHRAGGHLERSARATPPGTDGAKLAEFADDRVTASCCRAGRRRRSEWASSRPRTTKAAHKLLRGAGGQEPSSACRARHRLDARGDTASTPGLDPSALELVIADVTRHRNSLIAWDPRGFARTPTTRCIRCA